VHNDVAASHKGLQGGGVKGIERNGFQVLGPGKVAQVAIFVFVGEVGGRDPDLKAIFQKFPGDVTADETGAADDTYCLHSGCRLFLKKLVSYKIQAVTHSLMSST